MGVDAETRYTPVPVPLTALVVETVWVRFRNQLGFVCLYLMIISNKKDVCHTLLARYG